MIDSRHTVHRSDCIMQSGHHGTCDDVVRPYGTPETGAVDPDAFDPELDDEPYPDAAPDEAWSTTLDRRIRSHDVEN